MAELVQVHNIRILKVNHHVIFDVLYLYKPLLTINGLHFCITV